jgi:thiol:disulfide interchange protein DsbD
VARVALSAQRSESPASMQVVLVVDGTQAGAQAGAAEGAAGLQLALPVSGTWPSAPAAGTTPSTAPTPAPPPGAAGTAPSALGLAGALLLALVGGMLLNLMPCVFPVLSLKVLSLAAHGASRRALLAGGLAYTAGVVLSRPRPSWRAWPCSSR